MTAPLAPVALISAGRLHGLAADRARRRPRGVDLPQLDDPQLLQVERQALRLRLDGTVDLDQVALHEPERDFPYLSRGLVNRHRHAPRSVVDLEEDVASRADAGPSDHPAGDDR